MNKQMIRKIYPSNYSINTPFSQLKFLSLHNSYIDGQYNGILTDKYVINILQHIDKFPICIELDIGKNTCGKRTKINSKNFSKLIIDHETKETNLIGKKTLYTLNNCFEDIKRKIDNKKTFYPVLILVDLTCVMSLQCPTKLGKLIKKKFNKIFKNYIIDNLELTSPLKNLFNKVILRINKCNIPFPASKSFGVKYNYGKLYNNKFLNLVDTNKIYKVFPESLNQTKLLYKILTLKNIKCHSKTLNTNHKNETKSCKKFMTKYKKLNQKILEGNFEPKYSHINIFAFNYQDVDLKYIQELIKAFKKAYKNSNPSKIIKL